MSEMMFVVAKAFSFLLSPLPVTVGLLVVGLFFLLFTKKQKTGKLLVSGAAIILLVFSSSYVSNRLLEPIENVYPQLKIATNSNLPVKWIVVLGGGHRSDPNIPLTAQVSTASLARLTEGVRLYRAMPGSKIILSGGAVFDPVPEVETEAKIAAIMNVNKNDLVLEKRSKDTEDQAQFIKNIVGNDRFVLVTSASHMPRSVALFQKVGLEPVPAPTNHKVVKSQGSSPGDFFPSPGALSNAETALYEYLCTCWSKLRNKM